MLPIRALGAALVLLLSSGLKTVPYLQLPGITGESKDDAHKGWIELESVSMGVHAGGGGGAASGGRGTQQATHEIHVVKATDKSSPYLMQAVANGRHFPTAEIDMGTVRYVMKDVIISSLQHSGSASAGSGQPTESLTLDYQSIQYVYAQQQPETKGTPIAATVPRTTMTPAPVAGTPPATAPSTTMRAAAAAPAPATSLAPSAAATLDAQLRPSLSGPAKQWVGTEGRTLSQATGTADQLAASAHRAALARFGGIQPNVAGALSFLALMDAAKVNHSAQLQSAIQQVMPTTSPAAAGGLVNLK